MQEIKHQMESLEKQLRDAESRVTHWQDAYNGKWWDGFVGGNRVTIFVALQAAAREVETVQSEPVNVDENDTVRLRHVHEQLQRENAKLVCETLNLPFDQSWK